MKKIGYITTLLLIATALLTCGRPDSPSETPAADSSPTTAASEHEWGQALQALIAHYALARETSDTLLLKSILTEDIDQLVSSGEWRYGLAGAMQGMLQSSAGNPGTRTLTVENIRFLSPESGIVDARYEIRRADGSARKMWSTFVVVREGDEWKITAIRNMLPAGG